MCYLEQVSSNPTRLAFDFAIHYKLLNEYKLQHDPVVGEENRSIEQHVASGRILKRATDDGNSDEKPVKKATKTKKTTTAKPEDSATTTGKPGSKTRSKALKKTEDGPQSFTTTTKIPKGSITKAAAADRIVHGTKKAGKKDAKPQDDDDPGSGDSKTTPLPDDKETTSSTKLRSTIHRRPGKISDRNRLRQIIANERWLQNQEAVAVEHMLAGVYDWIKVLKQTDGRTYNRISAGELFDKIENVLIKILREDDQPPKLIEYYREHKL